MTMALRLNWLAIAAEFVRLRPKTSAAIAFELGILAAQAVTRATSKRRAAGGPSRFIALSPSLAAFEDYLPGRSKATAPKRRRKPAAKRTVPRVKKALRKTTDSTGTSA